MGLIRKILIELYQGQSVANLAKKYGVSERSIRRWAKFFEDLVMVFYRNRPYAEKPKTMKKRLIGKIKKTSIKNQTITIQIKFPLS
jgi:transposase